MVDFKYTWLNLITLFDPVITAFVSIKNAFDPFDYMTTFHCLCASIDMGGTKWTSEKVILTKWIVLYDW